MSDNEFQNVKCEQNYLLSIVMFVTYVKLPETKNDALNAKCQPNNLTSIVFFGFH